jgi:hypothetical protein
MGVTIEKYWVSVSLCPELRIIAKTVGQPLRILSKNLSFLKTCKNPYTGPLCITDPQFGDHNKKYWVSVSFFSKLVIFAKTVG